MSNIDIQIISTQATITRVKRERQLAQSEHDTAVFATCRRFSKAERQLSKAGKRSRLHLYMDDLRVGGNMPSPYTLQKQAVVCMTLHNLEAMSKQQVLLERDHQYLVRSLDDAGKGIKNEMRVRKDTIIRQKAVIEGQIEELTKKSEETVMAQGMIIEHLRGNILANKEDTSTIKHDDADDKKGIRALRSSRWSVQGVVGNIQKRHDSIKSTLREQSFPNLSGGVPFLTLRRQCENTKPMKVVAKVA
jgi:hypothetical protein